MRTPGRILALALLALALPSFAAAQTTDAFEFKKQGVFGCSVDGAHSMSVGSLSAVGGVYVPVNDAAVTLNTGYLVYKECVLRGVVNRQREAITSETVKKIVTDFLTARDGNALFPKDLTEDQKNERTRSVVKSLTNGSLDNVNPAFKAEVGRAIARNYSATLNKPTNGLDCDYSGDLKNDVQKNQFSWDLWRNLANPACNPYYAYQLADQYVADVATADVAEMMEKLGWGDGLYDVVTYNEFGDPLTVTPATLVNGNIQYALQSGFRQQESANDIDQMVGALFGGMSAQIIGDARGLAGLIQPTGSRGSYLDQVVREANVGVRQAAANAALQILSSKRTIERQFNEVMKRIANILSNAISGLRSRERQCWELVINAVCVAAPDANKKCTAVDLSSDESDESTSSGIRLQVATSTQFSQPIINARIASLASSTVSNISSSDRAIELIDRLIAGVSNSSSLDAQRVALQQLDTLVAQRSLHSEADVTAAQTTLETITSQMETLLTDTVTDWTTNPNPDIGWCKIDNNAVKQKWIDEWKI